MDTLSAFAMGKANRNNKMRVFDWDRAARRIREERAHRASAGLQGDWDYTGGAIYVDGEPVPDAETYTYLASTWAMPELMIDGLTEPCWVWEDDTEWTAETYWPESALNILRND